MSENPSVQHHPPQPSAQLPAPDLTPERAEQLLGSYRRPIWWHTVPREGLHPVDAMGAWRASTLPVRQLLDHIRLAYDREGEDWIQALPGDGILPDLVHGGTHLLLIIADTLEAAGQGLVEAIHKWEMPLAVATMVDNRLETFRASHIDWCHVEQLRHAVETASGVRPETMGELATALEEQTGVSAELWTDRLIPAGRGAGSRIPTNLADLAAEARAASRNPLAVSDRAAWAGAA